MKTPIDLSALEAMEPEAALATLREMMPEVGKVLDEIIAAPPAVDVPPPSEEEWSLAVALRQLSSDDVEALNAWTKARRAKYESLGICSRCQTALSGLDLRDWHRLSAWARLQTGPAAAGTMREEDL